MTAEEGSLHTICSRMGVCSVSSAEYLIGEQGKNKNKNKENKTAKGRHRAEPDS